MRIRTASAARSAQGELPLVVVLFALVVLWQPVQGLEGRCGLPAGLRRVLLSFRSIGVGVECSLDAAKHCAPDGGRRDKETRGDVLGVPWASVGDLKEILN